MNHTNYQKVAEFNVVFDCPRIYHVEFDRENWIKPKTEKVLKYRCDLIKEEGKYYQLYTNQFKSKVIEESKNG